MNEVDSGQVGQTDQAIPRVSVEMLLDEPQNDTTLRQRASRVGSMILGAISESKYKLEYAAVALRNDPLHYSKRALQGGYLAFQISLGNELARYSVFAATHDATDGNRLVSGVAFGLATFAVEATAAVVAADVFESDGAKSVIDKLHNKSSKLWNPSDTSLEKLPKLASMGIAMLGGTAILLGVKQAIDPTRNKQKNIHSGIKTAGVMAGYFTLEGAVTSQSLDTLGVPRTMAAGVLFLLGSSKLYNSFLKRKSKTSLHPNS